MRLLILTTALALTGCSCGTQRINKRSPRQITWVKVADASVKVSQPRGGPNAAVVPIPLDVDYVEPEKGVFTLETGFVSASEIDENTLSLGYLEVKKININKLDVCGLTEDQKCTDAVIVAYTTGAVAGFVNADEGYGVPLKVDGGATGLTGSELQISSYTIPASDRKLTTDDMSDITFELEVDISNAGAGTYGADLVFELWLGV
jgi:hypothetical protein